MDRQTHTLRPAVLVTLGLLAAAAPLSIDLYLAAFPAMTADLNTEGVGIQLSLTAFLLGAALGQVLFGPWSDRAGRLRPLTVGVIVYVVASAAAALAPGVAALVVARLLQGIGGSAGMVIGRAMILDRQQGPAAARGLNVMMAMSGVAPVVAPLLGSVLLGPVGWRGLLWVLCGVGVLSLLATLAVLRETLPATERERRRAHREPGAWRTLVDRRYLGGTVAFAATLGLLMAYISASPFVYQQVIGLSEVAYGAAFALNAVGMIATTVLSSRLAGTYTLRTIAGAGYLASGVGIVAALACAAAGTGGWALMVTLFVAVAPLGLVFGTMSALALSSVSPRTTGLASSLLGLLQFAVAGVVAGVVGIGGEDTAWPMALIMLACAIVAAGALAVMGRDTTVLAREPEPVRITAS